MHVQAKRWCISFGICIGHHPKWSLWQKNTQPWTIWRCEPLFLMRNWKTSRHFEANFNADVILTSITMPNEIILRESRRVQFICQNNKKNPFSYIEEHLHYWRQCLRQCHDVDIPKVFRMKINKWCMPVY